MLCQKILMNIKNYIKILFQLEYIQLVNNPIEKFGSEQKIS